MTVKYHYEQPAYLGLYKKQLPFTLLHRKGLTCFPLLTNYIEVLTNYIEVFTNYIEVLTNYIEVLTNYIEVLTNYIERSIEYMKFTVGIPL